MCMYHFPRRSTVDRGNGIRTGPSVHLLYKAANEQIFRPRYLSAAACLPISPSTITIATDEEILYERSEKKPILWASGCNFALLVSLSFFFILHFYIWFYVLFCSVLFCSMVYYIFEVVVVVCLFVVGVSFVIIFHCR